MNTNDPYRQQQDRESNLAPAYRNGFNQASRQSQDAWEDFNPRGGYLQDRAYQTPQFGYGQVGISPEEQYGQQGYARNTQFAHNEYVDEYAPRQYEQPYQPTQQYQPQPQQYQQYQQYQQGQQGQPYARQQQQQPHAMQATSGYGQQEPRPYPPHQPAYAGSQQGQHAQYGQASMAQPGSYQNTGGQNSFGYQGFQSYQGHGPKNYTRSDDRIREDVCERLTDSHSLNARDMDVQVKDGLATLSGTVASRDMKREAEDLTHACSGIKDVQNNLRIQPHSSSASGANATVAGTTVGSQASTQSSMASGTPRTADRH